MQVIKACARHCPEVVLSVAEEASGQPSLGWGAHLRAVAAQSVAEALGGEAEASGCGGGSKPRKPTELWSRMSSTAHAVLTDASSDARDRELAVASLREVGDIADLTTVIAVCVVAPRTSIYGGKGEGGRERSPFVRASAAAAAETWSCRSPGARASASAKREQAALEVVQTCLEDLEVVVRLQALDSTKALSLPRLGTLGRAVVARLGDPSALVRRRAANFLEQHMSGCLQGSVELGSKLKEEIRKKLNVPDFWVRWPMFRVASKCAVAFGEWQGMLETLALLDFSDDFVGFMVHETMSDPSMAQKFGCEERALRAVVAALVSGRPEDRAEAQRLAWQRRHDGPAGVSAAMLRAESKVLRAGALRSLGERAGRKLTVDDLTRHLDDDASWRLREAAASALGQRVAFGSAEAAAAARARLRHFRPRYRCTAVQILAEGDHPQLLAGHLQDNSDEVRAAAVRALARSAEVGRPSVEQALPELARLVFESPSEEGGGAAAAAIVGVARAAGGRLAAAATRSLTVLLSNPGFPTALGVMVLGRVAPRGSEEAVQCLARIAVGATGGGIVTARAVRLTALWLLPHVALRWSADAQNAADQCAEEAEEIGDTELAREAAASLHLLGFVPSDSIDAPLRPIKAMGRTDFTREIEGGGVSSWNAFETGQGEEDASAETTRLPLPYPLLASSKSDRKSADDAPPVDLQPGQEVVLTGLNIQAELNGSSGTIVQWEESSGRWIVFCADCETRWVRPANLESLPAPSMVASVGPD